MLQVTVHHTLGVDVLEPQGDLAYDVAGFGLWQLVDVAGEHVSDQISAPVVLCHQVREVFVLERFDEMSDIFARFEQASRSPLRESVLLGLVVVLCGFDDLDGDLLPGEAVLGSIDGVA